MVMGSKTNTLTIPLATQAYTHTEDKLLPHLNNAQINYNGPFNNLKDLICTLRKDLENEKTTELPNEEIVVFSPGATSFGMFANEFDRGEKLMKGIKEVFN